MEKYEIRVLEEDGWTIDCESPFEISHEETNSRATNYAAELVLQRLINLDSQEEYYKDI